MTVELLVDGPEFWARLQQDLEQAQEQAYVQTFSFEGDRVGRALGRALEGCGARDRRLLIDSYSLLYHSDRIIPGPAWLDRSLRSEVMITHRWVRRLRGQGVGVVFSNPLGPSPTKLVRRSHKKIALVDDRVAYLGGINFSEHNFAWHDMMFRVESRELASVLAEDFRATWNGTPVSMDRSVGPVRLISLNGRGNPSGLEPVMDAIRSATTSIDVLSAYLSHPFTSELGAARRRGVRVRVLTPSENNKANLARHIRMAAHHHDFELFTRPEGMSHVKAMLIDDALLVAGSSNFDFMSYHVLEELVFMSREPAMVGPFVERVWAPGFSGATSVRVSPGMGTRLGGTAVRAAAALAAAVALP
jgi:cardiolipin synthase